MLLSLSLLFVEFEGAAASSFFVAGMMIESEFVNDEEAGLCDIEKKLKQKISFETKFSEERNRNTFFLHSLR